MELTGTYRHELKYQISPADHHALRQRLRAVMKRDPHTRADGLYTIRSVYFDNYGDKALREKVNGVQKREKFRIRYYNDEFSFITLEKKIKHNDLCMKIDAPLTVEEYRRILQEPGTWMLEHPQPLVQELYCKMKTQQLRPRVLVSYVREPYIYNYAKISVNGEYWGVYLALEAVEDSFMLRNYGAQSGELYKPDSMNIGGGKDFGDFNADDMDFGDIDFGNMDFSNMDFGNMTPPDTQGNTNQANPPVASGQTSDDAFDPSQKPDSSGENPAESPTDSDERPSMNFNFGGGMGGFSMGGSGANLNYTDDELDSYIAINDHFDTIDPNSTDSDMAGINNWFNDNLA